MDLLKTLNLAINFLYQKRKGIAVHFYHLSLEHVFNAAKRKMFDRVLTFPENKASEFIFDGYF